MVTKLGGYESLLVLRLLLYKSFTEVLSYRVIRPSEVCNPAGFCIFKVVQPSSRSVLD